MLFLFLVTVDLKPWTANTFETLVADKAIVAVGEPAFGTREFPEARQLLTEYLVREKGFTTIVVSTASVSQRLLHWADAKNVTILRGELPMGKVKTVVWGHNTQVAALREKLGDKVLIIGGIFDEGAFASRNGGVLETMQVASEPSSVAHALAPATIGALDLRGATWPMLNERRPVHQYGADFKKEPRLFALAALYDAVLFIRATTLK